MWVRGEERQVLIEQQSLFPVGLQAEWGGREWGEEEEREGGREGGRVEVGTWKREGES